MAERKQSIIWSPEAVADLDGIWDYFEYVADHQTAEKVTRNIYHRCDVLKDHIFAGHARDEVRSELYFFAAPPFTIFYRVNKSSIPEIIRVLHNRQDIDQAFS